MAKPVVIAAGAVPVTPYDLLSTPTQSGDPLFDSIADLAGTIAGLAGNIIGNGSRYKDIPSLVSTLSPILNLKRTADPELRAMIVQAFKRRAAARLGTQAEKLLEQLELLLNQEGATGTIRCERLTCAALIKHAHLCESLVAIVPPGALSDHSGRQVLRAIVERLGSISTTKVNTSEGAFWFLCPSPKEAIDLWRAVLLLWPSSSITDDNHHSALEEVLELNHRGALKVFAVSEELCLFPVIVFNPANESIATAFAFDVVAPSVLSLCRMSQASLQRWLQAVFLRLKLSDRSLGKAVPLSEAFQLT